MIESVRVETPTSKFVLTDLSREDALRLRTRFRTRLGVTDNTWVYGDRAHQYLRHVPGYREGGTVRAARLRLLLARPSVNLTIVTSRGDSAPAKKRKRA